MRYVFDDDHLDLDFVGQLDYLFVSQDQGFHRTDVQKGAGFASQVSQVVGLVLEDDLSVFAADGELVGVAEVVLRRATELGPRQVEHFAFVAVQILSHPVIDGVTPLGVEVSGGLSAVA